MEICLTGGTSHISFRVKAKNNYSILIVFAPVHDVPSAVAYSEYAPADAPCRRNQIRRNYFRLNDSAICRSCFMRLFLDGDRCPTVLCAACLFRPLKPPSEV
jgi:hypothetical protein